MDLRIFQLILLSILAKSAAGAKLLKLRKLRKVFCRILPIFCDDESPLTQETAEPRATMAPSIATPANVEPRDTMVPSIATPETVGPRDTMAPSMRGSDHESYDLEDFLGILDAFSAYKGTINVAWDDVLLDDLGVSYNVFVALGNYNFSQYGSIEDLIEIFDVEPSFQHIQIVGKDDADIISPYEGELHTLMVTAEKGGKHSTSLKSVEVTVSSSDPHIRDEVNVVGLFIPTSRVDISIEDSPDSTEHTLSFIGPVAPEAQALKIGDFVTGLSSNFRPFVCRIITITENSPNGVIMTVLNAPLEDIFDSLDLDANFDISRQMTGNARRRRLRHKSILRAVKSLRNVGRVIGDFFTNVVTDPVRFIREIFGAERLQNFNLIDIDRHWNYVDETESDINGTEVSATLTLSGSVRLEVVLFARVRIVGPTPVFMSVGSRANYAFESDLETSAGISREYKKTHSIWTGPMREMYFFIGPVPIQLYGRPKLDLNVNLKSSLNATAKAGISVSGNTEAEATHDARRPTRVLGYRYKPPTFDFDYILPTVEGRASLRAGASLVISVEAGINGGMLAANVGLSGGLDLQASAGLVSIRHRENIISLPSINKFDMDLIFSIPFSASALWKRVNIYETTIFKKKWPIITLPSVTIEILKDHRCLLGESTEGSIARFSLKAKQEYTSDSFIKNGFIDNAKWYLVDSIDNWSVREMSDNELSLEKTGLVTTSPRPIGTVVYSIRPVIPPLPLNVLSVVSLGTLFPAEEEVQCVDAGPCDGDMFFEKLIRDVGERFNSELFRSRQPDPTLPLVPSSIYKFEDFMTALKKLRRASEDFQFWLGDDCSEDSRKAALVNIAAFLGQSMRETIIYDACDEHNWDKWRADIYKEPTSPPQEPTSLPQESISPPQEPTSLPQEPTSPPEEITSPPGESTSQPKIFPVLYPMSSGCGQLGQKYAEYRCEDECPMDASMELTATTNAKWIGAPPPLFCGPKSKFNGLGYWNPMQFCGGPDRSCVGETFYYPGQLAGVHVSKNEDPRFPDFFYTNPLPDMDGITPAARTPDAFPSTDVENCCWWGRGVIQTTGRCNFGKLNKHLGVGAGADALYPDINFCKNPQAVCTGPSDLKWVAGIFFWVSNLQVYDRDGFNYIQGVKDFVSMGCADDLYFFGCSSLFVNASGIVNRGCHNPGETGCMGCVPGATCGPADDVPERLQASQEALRVLLSLPQYNSV
jgi:hypothetical protein